MSSTEAPASVRALDAFVATADRIGRQLRASGEPFFDVPPTSDTSYFVMRNSTRVTRATLEGPACASPEELERKLAAMWSTGGATALASLAPAAAALAEALRAERKAKDDNGDVTPFLYAMF